MSNTRLKSLFNARAIVALGNVTFSSFCSRSMWATNKKNMTNCRTKSSMAVKSGSLCDGSAAAAIVRPVKPTPAFDRG